MDQAQLRRNKISNIVTCLQELIIFILKTIKFSSSWLTIWEDVKEAVQGGKKEVVGKSYLMIPVSDNTQEDLLSFIPQVRSSVVLIIYVEIIKNCI